MDINKNKIYRRKRFWAGLLLAQFLLFLLFSKLAFVVRFFEQFFDFQKRVHQKLFSGFPFALGDIFYVILGLVFIYYIFKIFKKRTREKYLLRLLMLINLLYFTYQIFWGMLYFQEPLIKKFQGEEITIDETKALSVKYLNLCKQTRSLVQEDRNGVFKIADLKSIKQEILLRQNALPLTITEKKGTNVNSFKPSLFKGIMSYSGILGYYNLFTAEAQYNSELPSTYLPFTLAHESAHQMGFAREQEANFIGFLLGKNSNRLELKYSTEYFALKSLLNSIITEDPEFVKQMVNQFSPGMKRDRLWEKSFQKKHMGLLDDFFAVTNDLFLKSNQQEGSVTYSYFNELLIHHEREGNKRP